MSYVPVNAPLLNGNEKKYLVECIDSGWISSEGPFVERFECAVAARMGRRYGIAVSSGTAAIDLAIEALNLEPGDEVIMPSLTIISCVLQVVRVGAVPVLVDAHPRTWNMDVNQVEAKITARTRAVLAVHIYGLPVDMDPLLSLAKAYDLVVIEDAAEVIGQDYNGAPCGSFGAMSTLSFYPNKHITTGEGGMVLTDDEHYASTIRSLRNLCMQSDRRFVHERLGWNYRMTNLQAAVGLAQLERLDEFVEKKRWIGRLYSEMLRDITGLDLPLTETLYAKNIYWVYGLIIDSNLQVDARSAMKSLSEQGIGTRPFFCPLHQQPILRKMGLSFARNLEVSDQLYKYGFYIPSGLALDSAQIEHVVLALRSTFRS